MGLKRDLLDKTENLPSNLYLSEKVKERRKSLKITQEEIAEAIGVDVKTYRHWENGKNMPESIASLYKLCTCLDCEIDFLFDKISLPHKADTDIVDYTGLSENAVMNLRRYSKDELYPKELISRLLSEESFYRIFFKINKYLELQKMESSETREYNQYLINEIEKNEYIPNEIKLFEMFKNRLSPNELSAYFILEATKQIEVIFRQWGYLEKYEKK